MYKKCIKSIFFKFNPEKVHSLVITLGQILGSNVVTKKLVSLMYRYKGKDISKVVDGIKYETPILLSAGFDYDGKLVNILDDISFGGVEIGSVTAKPCEGNPKPNLTRLPNTKSIIVNKGLKNDGVDRIIKRLKGKKFGLVVGISIAKTNCKDCVSVEEGIEDYLYSFRRLNEEGVGDYYTINISCPNAYGGEAFIDPDKLERLFSELDRVKCNLPVYVKMPVRVSNELFVSLLKVLDIHRVSGVIIGNLQKDYSYIDDRDIKPDEYRGGLSGKPCSKRSNELIRLTKDKYNDRFTIIGCGGIFSYEDAKEKFELGCDLIQLITGMIYEGPGLIKDICEGVARDIDSFN